MKPAPPVINTRASPPTNVSSSMFDLFMHAPPPTWPSQRRQVLVAVRLPTSAAPHREWSLPIPCPDPRADANREHLRLTRYLAGVAADHRSATNETRGPNWIA